MAEIPGVNDVTDLAKDSAADGVIYGLGTGIGRSTMGGLGHGLGGLGAGAAIGGQKGEMMASFAIGEAVRFSMMGSGGSSSNQNTRRRL